MESKKEPPLQDQGQIDVVDELFLQEILYVVLLYTKTPEIVKYCSLLVDYKVPLREVISSCLPGVTQAALKDTEKKVKKWNGRLC